ncbi:hypothetical protein SCHPADRAFT_947481 [Schizopora paradoxa]|uniref:DUF6533 domain-containing protein n=1 Tax=Schizopora paradoxa TaxID=27342 RepID=A0A0H2RIR3_9AGAM|nr:hypothetical protein SCHPADRAFT_947481 [Schizopora paradoxa]
MAGLEFELDSGGTSLLSEIEEAIRQLQNVQLAKYVVVATLCLLVYDYILTADEEFQLVWPSRWGMPKTLFFLNRYLAFVDPAMLLVVLVFGGSPEFCVRGFQILGGFSSFGFIIAQIILMMRAWAIWERGIIITTILAIMIVACVGVDVMVLKRYLSGITFIPSPARVLKGCLLSFSTRIVYVDFVLVMFSETVMLILLSLKAVKHFKHSRSTLMVTMYRDGIFYFCFIVVTSIANLVTILTAPIELHNFLIVTQRVLHSIFCTRVLLHIRGAYSNSGPYSESDARRAYNQSISLQNYSGRRDHLPRLEIRKDISVEKSFESGAVWVHGGGGGRGSRFGTLSSGPRNGSAWGSDVFLNDSFAVNSRGSMKIGSSEGDSKDKDVLDSELSPWGEDDDEEFDLGDPVMPRLSMNGGRATVYSASDEESQYRFSGVNPPSCTASRVGVAL